MYAASSTVWQERSYFKGKSNATIYAASLHFPNLFYFVRFFGSYMINIDIKLEASRFKQTSNLKEECKEVSPSCNWCNFVSQKFFVLQSNILLINVVQRFFYFWPLDFTGNKSGKNVWNPKPIKRILKCLRTTRRIKVLHH